MSDNYIFDPDEYTPNQRYPSDHWEKTDYDNTFRGKPKPKFCPQVEQDKHYYLRTPIIRGKNTNWERWCSPDFSGDYDDRERTGLTPIEAAKIYEQAASRRGWRFHTLRMAQALHELWQQVRMLWPSR